MFTRVSRLPGFTIIVGRRAAVNWLCGKWLGAEAELRRGEMEQSSVPTQPGSRYNRAMPPMLAAASPPHSRACANFFISGRDLGRFRRALLGWYDRHRRDLPWRETRDPYRVWLSEIMLQQTRVAAVLGHYRIFIERFPNVGALAAAPEEAVLAAWSGLGYYRRARRLHQCANEIVQKHRGRFPQTAAALLALPGIGRYTAAAIASIAFAEPVAVVDGNVERVLRRLLCAKSIGIKSTGIDLTTAQIWQHAQSLLTKSRPGDFNQAMMELGATVCVPRQPRCLACPVRKWCVAQGEVPLAQPPARQEKMQIWCVLDWRGSNGNSNIHGIGNINVGGEVRLVQRSKKASLMPGMWELPQSSEPPRSLPATAPWRTFRHTITITDYTVHVLRNTLLRNNRLRHTPLPDALPVAKGKWVAVGRIPWLPITGLTRKILKAGGII
jgi:A/G-specific adenine glycosylase